MKRVLLIAMLTIVTLALQAQDTTVRGTVVDNHNEPMPGVTVEIVGTPETATTDIDGRFVIHLTETAKKVKAKYPGYSSKDKKITDNMVIMMFPKTIQFFVDLQGGIGIGNKKDITAGNVLITDLKNTASFGANISLDFPINPNLSLGLGVGITCNPKVCKATELTQNGNKSSQNFTDILVPYFAEARWVFNPQKKGSPFVYLKAGYQIGKPKDISIPTESPDDRVILGYSGKHGLFLQPAVGYRIFFRDNTAINFALAYSVTDPRKFKAYYKNNTIDIGSIKGGALLLNVGFEFNAPKKK